MAGDIKLQYVATSTPTVTNLQSLASSQTWIAGWGGNSVSNASNEYLDYMYGFQFTTHASNRQAGLINIYVIGALNDTPLYPAVSSGTLGTEGAIAFSTTFLRDAIVRPMASIVVDNTASAILTVPMAGIAQFFGGVCPINHVIFIAQNASTTTTAGLASSGNAVYFTPVMDQYT